MRKLNNLLLQTYFLSASHTTQQFLDFYKEFCRLFSLELKKIKATNIKFSQGHFYVSGFFTVGEKIFYFSLSDVRDNSTQLLIRTAQSYTDYTGGQNNYVEINVGMAKQISKLFRLEFDEPKKREPKALNVDLLVEKLKQNGTIQLRVNSNKKAANLAWRITDKLGQTFKSITYHRWGRTIFQIFAENEVADFKFDSQNKKFTLTLQTSKEEVFLSTLQKYEEGSNVMNPFSNESCYLDAEQLALYDFIKGAERTRHTKFQFALSIFRKKYPEQYMVLLD